VRSVGVGLTAASGSRSRPSRRAVTSTMGRRSWAPSHSRGPPTGVHGLCPPHPPFPPPPALPRVRTPGSTSRAGTSTAAIQAGSRASGAGTLYSGRPSQPRRNAEPKVQCPGGDRPYVVRRVTVTGSHAHLVERVGDGDEVRLLRRRSHQQPVRIGLFDHHVAHRDQRRPRPLPDDDPHTAPRTEAGNGPVEAQSGPMHSDVSSSAPWVRLLPEFRTFSRR
jgi:hypothetical protein